MRLKRNDFEMLKKIYGNREIEVLYRFYELLSSAETGKLYTKTIELLKFYASGMSKQDMVVLTDIRAIKVDNNCIIVTNDFDGMLNEMYKANV